MASEPTMRCTVEHDGAKVQTELLHAIPYSALEAMYQPSSFVHEATWPPTPEEDGVYLLIDNVWIREED